MTRRDNEDIVALTDLAEKRVATRSMESLAGVLMQWRELNVAGIQPFVNVAQVRFPGRDARRSADQSLF